MNRKALLAIAAFATLAGTAARADDITIDNTPFQSTRTRVEVQAELFQYQKAGVNPWSTRYNPLASFKSTRTRDEVVAEYRANRDAVDAINGEDSGSVYFAQSPNAQRLSATLAGTPVNAQ
jgi:hypothetical protein